MQSAGEQPAAGQDDFISTERLGVAQYPPQRRTTDGSLAYRFVIPWT